MCTKELVDENITLLVAPEMKDLDLIVAYQSEAMNGEVYYVFVNSDSQARTYILEEDLTKCDCTGFSRWSRCRKVSEKKGYTLNASNITIEPLTTIE